MYQPLAAAAPGGDAAPVAGRRRRALSATRTRRHTDTDTQTHRHTQTQTHRHRHRRQIRSVAFRPSFSAWRMSRATSRATTPRRTLGGPRARRPPPSRRSPPLPAASPGDVAGGGGGGGVRGGRLAHAQVRAVGEEAPRFGDEGGGGARAARRVPRAQAVGPRGAVRGGMPSGERRAERRELSALFVDASAAKWMTEKNASASQGESLLRLICARLEQDDTDISVIRAACRRWARLVALEPAMPPPVTARTCRGGRARSRPRAEARRRGAGIFCLILERKRPKALPPRRRRRREERRGRVPK